MRELNVMNTVKPVSASMAAIIAYSPKIPNKINVMTTTLTSKEKMILKIATVLVFFAILIES